MHAMVIVALVAPALLPGPASWQSSSDLAQLPVVELSIVRPEPVPPPPEFSALPRAMDPPVADPPPPPPPPVSMAEAPELADLVPLPDAAPPVTAPPQVTEAAPPPVALPPPPPVVAQPPTPSLPPPPTRDDYMLQVIRTLARSPYIPRVRLEGRPGIVVTRLTVGPDGRLLQATLENSSGFPDLDNRMMEAIWRAGPFPPPPHGNGLQDRYTLVVPIRFMPLETSRAH